MLWVRQIGGATAVAAALVVALTPASASADLRYEKEKFRVEPNERVGARVACDKGLHVISGGIGQDPGEAVMVQSAPVDRGDRNEKPDDAWRTVVDNQGLVEVRAAAWAICSDEQPRYRFKETTATADVTKRLECPGDARAVAAGGITHGQAHLRAWAPFEFGGDKSGAVSIFVSGDPSAEEVTLVAVCTEGGGLKYVRDTFEVPTFGEIISGEELQCPEDRLVLGGGAFPPAPGNGTELETTDSFPTDGVDSGGRPDDVWFLTTDDLAGTTETVDAVAVCGRN